MALGLLEDATDRPADLPRVWFESKGLFRAAATAICVPKVHISCPLLGPIVGLEPLGSPVLVGVARADGSIGFGFGFGLGAGSSWPAGSPTPSQTDRIGSDDQPGQHFRGLAGCTQLVAIGCNWLQTQRARRRPAAVIQTDARGIDCLASAGASAVAQHTHTNTHNELGRQRQQVGRLHNTGSIDSPATPAKGSRANKFTRSPA